MDKILPRILEVRYVRIKWTQLTFSNKKGGFVGGVLCVNFWEHSYNFKFKQTSNDLEAAARVEGHCYSLNTISIFMLVFECQTSVLYIHGRKKGGSWTQLGCFGRPTGSPQKVSYKSWVGLWLLLMVPLPWPPPCLTRWMNSWESNGLGFCIPKLWAEVNCHLSLTACFRYFIVVAESHLIISETKGQEEVLFLSLWLLSSLHH